MVSGGMRFRIFILSWGRYHHLDGSEVHNNDVPLVLVSQINSVIQSASNDRRLTSVAGKDSTTDSHFINTARTLCAAKLERVRDENGNEVPLDMIECPGRRCRGGHVTGKWEFSSSVDILARSRPISHDRIITPRFPEIM